MIYLSDSRRTLKFRNKETGLLKLSTFALCLDSILKKGGFEPGKERFTDKPEELSYKIPFHKDSLTAMYLVLADLPFYDGEISNYGAFDENDISRWYSHRAVIYDTAKESVLNKAGWEEIWLRTERGQARGWDVVLSKLGREDFFVSHMNMKENLLSPAFSARNSTYISETKILNAIDTIVSKMDKDTACYH